jgi:hypothetical protein
MLLLWSVEQRLGKTPVIRWKKENNGKWKVENEEIL